MTAVDDRNLLVDTNVLLTATAPARELNSEALEIVDDWPNRGIRLCTCGQVLREYLVVATRPLADNGLGLSVGDALGNVAALAARMKFLDEDGRVAAQLRELVARGRLRGRGIHDANIVAVAVAHRIPRLVTANVTDFSRFGGLVEVVDLAAV